MLPVIFMNHSPRKGNGWWSVLTAVAGDRATSRLAGVLIAMAIGNGLTPAGIGSAMNHGRGQHIIMVAGISPINMAGIGCRKFNGRRLGFPGMKVAVMLAGHRCNRQS